MIEPHPSPIVRLVCRVAARVIQVFALYVIFHGHYSPGGGFQGGALLASSIFLLRWGEGAPHKIWDLPQRVSFAVGAIGTLIFTVTGVFGLFSADNFLNYSALPLPGMSDAMRHYWGILIIEIGVALAVMAILVAIFDQLMNLQADD